MSSNDKKLYKLLIRLVNERKELKKKLEIASHKLGVIDQIALEDRYARIGQSIQRLYSQLSWSSRVNFGAMHA